MPTLAELERDAERAANDVLRAKLKEARDLRDTYAEAISWMEIHNPQLVGAARKKFAFQ
jgi:hypothetical protein